MSSGRAMKLLSFANCRTRLRMQQSCCQYFAVPKRVAVGEAMGEVLCIDRALVICSVHPELSSKLELQAVCLSVFRMDECGQSWQSSYPDPASGARSKLFADPTGRPAATVVPAG